MSSEAEVQDQLRAGGYSRFPTAYRAAELLNGGDADAALRMCEDLFRIGYPDPEAVDVALWVAHTAQADDLATRLYRLAAERAPFDAARQRAAASYLLRCGHADEAVVFAAAACELAPDDADCAFLLGVIRNEAGLFIDAIKALLRAVKLRPDFAEAYHHLAYASTNLGLAEPAAKLALSAFRFDPLNPARAVFAAHLLRQVKRLDEAIEVLETPPAIGQAGAALCRVSSDCHSEAGRRADALAKIDQALALAPLHPEYLLHRASLLTQEGNYEEATKGVDAALRSDPDNLGARRHAVSLYLESGRLDRAVATTAELLRQVPDNAEYASCMMHVLSVRAERSVELPDLAKLKRRSEPRAPLPVPTLVARLKSQARVTAALLLWEMRTRFGESRLGYLWVILEMVIHLGVLAIVFQFVMHGEPPMGHSFFFFYFTGLTPYLAFLHTSEHAGHAIVQNRHMLQLPMVTHVNVIMARGVLELFTSFVVSGLFLAGFLAAGIDALPHSFGGALAALLTAWLFGLGCGFINAVFNTFFHFWHHVMSVVIRVLYFCSGIFYVPGIMPIGVRDAMAWNPLLHCIDWFRLSFFEGYAPHWLDRGYAVVFALCLVLVGMLLEASCRRRLRQPA